MKGCIYTYHERMECFQIWKTGQEVLLIFPFVPDSIYGGDTHIQNNLLNSRKANIHKLGVVNISRSWPLTCTTSDKRDIVVKVSLV